MRSGQRHSGFSLMEVLFAVTILSLGLVFVASQFPVGIWAARDVRDSVVGSLDTANCEAMAEVKLGRLRGMWPGAYSSPWKFREAVVRSDEWIRTYADTVLGIDYAGPGIVHSLVKANVLTDSGVNIEARVVVDDPEDTLDLYANVGGLLPYPGVYPELRPLIDVDALGVAGAAYEYLLPSAIGAFVTPEVGRDTPEVVRWCFANYGGTYTDWDPVDDFEEPIFWSSLERSTSWAALYQCLDVGSPDRRHRYKFTFFNLRRNMRANVAYASQRWHGSDPLQHEWALGVIPTPQTIVADRMFPVPWRVYLGAVQFAGVREFAVPADLDPYLRVGTVLVDGDSEDPAAFVEIPVAGEVYTIEEIYLNENDLMTYIVLDRALESSLEYVVFFPPAIDMNGEPTDTQPVIEWKQAVLEF